MIFASGTWPVNTIFGGSTTSELGAIPKLHCIIAPMQTCIAILNVSCSMKVHLSPHRRKHNANRLRDLQRLSCRLQAPALRIDAELNDIAGVLIGGEKIGAGRIDLEIAWGLALRRDILDQLYLAALPDAEHRDAVVPAV